MGYADSPDPEHPGPDFLANPPFQQPGQQAQFYAPMPQNTAPSW